jgi:hypothetical protein
MAVCRPNLEHRDFQVKASLRAICFPNLQFRGPARSQQHPARRPNLFRVDSYQEIALPKAGSVRRSALLNILEHPPKPILRFTLLQSGADRLAGRQRAPIPMIKGCMARTKLRDQIMHLLFELCRTRAVQDLRCSGVD